MKKNILFVLFISICVCVTGCWDKGTGEKIGTIIKLSKEGYFVKTWEGEIIRGGINNGSGVMGTSFHFTIEDESLVEKVKKAMDAQQEVKISYHMEAITCCRSDSDDHFLTKIEPLSEVSTPPIHTQGTVGISTSDQTAILQIMKRQQELNEENQKLIEQLLKSQPTH